MSLHDKLLQNTANIFARMGAPASLWIAYSGGVDSHVLLHVMWQLRERKIIGNFRAVHVNHGISINALQWQHHCERICAALNVPLDVLRIEVDLSNQPSLEQNARQHRYRVMAKHLPHNACVALAHHQDDQAETLLIQLLRGSGPKGLASMPYIGEMETYNLVRPLLDSTREGILNYADYYRLEWVEDESNQARCFDRNYLRHEILPLIKKRWPSYNKTIARSAHLCAEMTEEMERQALDLIAKHPTHNKSELNVTILQQLTHAQKINVLRCWIQLNNFRLPSQVVMNSIVSDLLQAAHDATPIIKWSGAEMRRYREALFIMNPLHVIDRSVVYNWDGVTELCIPNCGRLTARRSEGRGIKAELWQNRQVCVKFRGGGETWQPNQQTHHVSLKKWFQQQAIAPWIRQRLPLIYLDTTLIAIADIAVCKSVTAHTGEASIELNWEACGAHHTDNCGK